MHLSIIWLYNKTASRNVAFKAARLSESVLESQEEIIVRKPEADKVGSDDYDKAAVLQCY